MPKRITSAMEGSQTSKEGKDRKASTFAGEDICVMCNPRPNSSPAKNCEAWRAVLSGLVWSSVFVTPAMRRGNSWQVIIVAAASVKSDVVVSGEGYVGV